MHFHFLYLYARRYIDSRTQTQNYQIGTVISYVGDDKYTIKFERKEHLVADDVHCNDLLLTYFRIC